MNIKRFLPCLLAGLLVGALISPYADAGPKKNPSPLIVGTDKAGDWGENVHASLPPVGDQLGMDLLGASIAMGDAATINFIIRVTNLPAVGGTPEISRYVWEMSVDGDFFMLDAKFTNYTRGTCDPFSGACPPPRDPGMYPVIVYDGCDIPVYWHECHEVGLVKAIFDPSSGTITVPVPLQLIGAESGSRIGAGGGPFFDGMGGNVVAGFAAYRTTAGFPWDAMKTKRAFVVPRG